jgi:uncharacterized protein
VGAVWQEIHLAYIDKEQRWDYRAPLMLVVVAVSLTCQEYFGDRSLFRTLEWIPHELRFGPHWELWSFCWWSGWRVLGFLVFPVVVILCMPGERLRDYFWSPKGFFRHIGLYLVLYAAVLPLVLYMASTKDFQRIYPFYKRANCSTFDFVAWEVLYALQFLSLEFFFRGFMLYAGRRVLGVHAVWVMIVPYCMIHYGKTFAETMGAIVAGLVLGTIAMRTRSIWGGVFVHIAVAVTMDYLTVDNLKPCKP